MFRSSTDQNSWRVFEQRCRSTDACVAFWGKACKSATCFRHFFLFFIFFFLFCYFVGTASQPLAVIDATRFVAAGKWSRHGTGYNCWILGEPSLYLSCSLLLTLCLSGHVRTSKSASGTQLYGAAQRLRDGSSAGGEIVSGRPLGFWKFLNINIHSVSDVERMSLRPRIAAQTLEIIFHEFLQPQHSLEDRESQFIAETRQHLRIASNYD